MHDPVQMPIDKLCNDWRKLKSALYDCDDISIKFFQEVFKNTEQCLQQCIAVDAISKVYIPLIADVYAFVDADAGTVMPRSRPPRFSRNGCCISML